MSHIDPNEICENCRHFSAEQPGECRKYAPRGKSKWTLVTKTDWCSEFKGRPSEKKGSVHVG